MTASKQKGTGGETELLRLLALPGLVRTPASSTYDLSRPAVGPWFGPPIQALATRPDRGQWLITLRATDFAELVGETEAPLEIEVKRYRRFSLHSIFE